MSDTEKKELDAAQEDQDEVEEAGTDPKTSGSAESLRGKAANTTDKSPESEESA
jgi:hypothetical protein